MKQFINRLVVGSVIFVLLVNPALAALQNSPTNYSPKSVGLKLKEKIQTNQLQAVSAGSTQASTAAGVVLDANNHQTDLKKAANGTTVVDIATPTAKGVSQNNFAEFNVDQAGIIFNNSQGPVLTQLGGWSDGNRRLAGGPAKIILTQVTGTNRSQLLGQIEIAGQSADFILANANGITCNGCGFINTPRVSLVTGNAQYAADGSLGFNILGGDVSIEGQGLNASNISRFDILTRAAKINAAIYANELNIITGKNSVDYALGSVTSLNDSSNNTPIEFAIDSTLLGGMYANSIRLIGTEKGVGVNTQGLVQSVGDLEISADGDIHLKNAQANNHINIQSQSGSINNQGTVYGKTVNLNGATYLANNGLLAAEENMILSADFFDQRGNLYAGLKADNSLTGTGNFSAIFKNGITNLNDFYVAGTAQVDLGSLDNQGNFVLQNEKNITGISRIKNTGNLQFNAADSVRLQVQSLENTGTLSYSGNGLFTLNSVQSLQNSRGILSAHGDLAIVASDLDNNQGVISANALQITSDNIKNISGTLESKELKISANQLDNTLGLIAAIPTTSGAVNNSEIHLTDELNNQQGTIYLANAKASLNAQTIDNHQGAIIFANHADGSISTQTDINNTLGIIQSGNLKLDAQNINNNQGQIIADVGVLTAQNINNDFGLLQAKQWQVNATQYQSNAGYWLATDTNNGSLQITLSGSLAQSNGAVIQSQSGLLSIQADQVSNQNSAIYSLGNLESVLSSNRLNNQSGALVSNGLFTIKTGDLDNSSGFLSGNGLNLTANQIINIDGLLKNTGTQFFLTADELNNTRGVLSSAGVTNISLVKKMDNTQGTLNASGDLLLTANDLINNQGSLIGSSNLTVNAANQLSNDAGQIIAMQQTKITSTNLKNGSGSITGKSLAILSGELNNDKNGILQADQLNLNAVKISNAGFIFASGQGATDFSLQTQSIYNSGTLESASKDWDLSQLSLINDHGALVHDGSGDLKLGSAANASVFDNSNSVIATQGTLKLNATSINNDHGTLIAAKDLDVHLQNLNNNFGVLQTGGSFNLQTDALNNANGNLILNGAGDATLSVTNAINNQNGNIVYSGQSQFSILADAINNRGGNIASQYDLTLTTNKSIDNAGNSNGIVGQISALNQFTLNTQQQINDGQLSAAHLSLNVQEFTNTSLANINVGDLHFINANNVTNQGNILLSNAQSNSLLEASIAFNNLGLIESHNAQLQLSGAQWINGKTISVLEGGLQINAQSFDNSNGEISAKTIQLNPATVKQFTNISGKITTDELSGEVTGFNNKKGLVQADTHFNLVANEFDNTSGGKLLIGGTDLAQLNAATLKNDGGIIAANQLNIQSNAFTNTQGQVIVDQLTLNANNLDNSKNGKITANKTSDLTVTQTLNNKNGVLQADGSSLTIHSNVLDDTDGQIILNGIGSLRVSTDQLLNEALSNSNAGIFSGKDITITTTQNFNNNGYVLAQGDLNIDAANFSNASSASLLQATNLTVKASDIQNAGTFYSSNLVLNGASATNNNQIILNGTTNFNLTSRLVNKGSIENSATNWALSNIDNQKDIQLIGSGKLTLSNTSNASLARILSNGDILLQDNASRSQWNNAGLVSAFHDLTVVFDEVNNNNGILAAASNLSITAKNLTNQHGLIQLQGASANSITLDVSNQLDNSQQGVIQSNAKDLNLHLNYFDNSNGGLINHQGAGLLNIVALNGINNTSGEIQSLGDVYLTANDATASIQNGQGFVHGNTIELTAGNSISNTGIDSNHIGEIVGKNITLTAKQIDNSYGHLIANDSIAGAITFNTSNIVKNTYGEISSSATDWTLNLDLFDNTSGSIVHAGNGHLNLTSSTLLSNAGTISSQGDLNITADGLSNSGKLVSDKNLTLSLSKDFQNTAAGIIYSKQYFSVLENNANTIDFVNAGDITVNGIMNLQTGSGNFTNNGSLVLLGGANTWSFNQFTNNNSFGFGGAGELKISANQFTNRGDFKIAQGTLTLDAAAVSNESNIVANQFNAINVATFNNKSKADISTNQFQINSLSNMAGTLINDGSIEAAGAVDSLQLYVSTLTNNGAITSNSLDQKFYGDFNNAGTFVHSNTGTLFLGETGVTHLNGSGQINSAGDILVKSSLLDSGKVFATQSLTIDSGNNLFVNNGITYYALDNVMINSALANKGKIYSDQNIKITTTGDVDNQGGIIQGYALNIDVGNITNQQNGKIISLGSADGSITAQSINNSGGIIQSENNNFSITAKNGDLVNDAGLIQHRGGGLLNLGVNGHNVNNNQGSILSAGTLSILDALEIKNTNTLRAKSDDSFGIEANNLNIKVNSLDNSSGYINSYGSNSLTLFNLVDLKNIAGTIYSTSSDFTINATNTFNNQNGLISHKGTGNLTLRAQSYDLSAASQILSAGKIDLKTTTASVTNSGKILGDAGVSLTANGFTNYGLVGSAMGDVNLVLDTFTLTNSGDGLTTGVINGNQLLKINASSIANDSKLASSEKVDITTNSFSKLGSIKSNNALVLTLNSGDLTLVAGDKIEAPNNLQINVNHGGINNSGLISSVNDMNLASQFLTNNIGGVIKAGANGTFIINGDLTNSGTISGAGSLTINAHNFVNNLDATVVTGGDLSFDLNNSNFKNYSRIFSNGNFSLINTNNFDNETPLGQSQAEIYSVGTFDVTTKGYIHNTAARLTSQGNMSLVSPSEIINQSLFAPTYDTTAPEYSDSSYTYTTDRFFKGIGTRNMTVVSVSIYQTSYSTVNNLDSRVNASISSLQDLTIGKSGDRILNVTNSLGDISAGGTLTADGNYFQLISATDTTNVLTHTFESWYFNGDCGFVGCPLGAYETNTLPDTTTVTPGNVAAGQVKAANAAIHFNAASFVPVTADPFNLKTDQPSLVITEKAGDANTSNAINKVASSVNTYQTSSSKESVNDPNFGGATVTWNDLKAGAGSNGKSNAADAKNSATGASSSGQQANQFVGQLDLTQLKNLAQAGSLNQLLAQLTDKGLTGEQLLALIAKIKSGENPFTTDEALQQFLSQINSWFNSNLSDADKALLLAQTDLNNLSANAKPQLGNTQAPKIISIDILPYGFDLSHISSLFVINNAPDALYLIETRPEFTQYGNFLGSDYLIKALGLDPAKTEKRLGDAFFEDQLIKDALMRDLATAYLDGQTDDYKMMQLLMDNAVHQSTSLQLSLGVELSPEQCAHLTEDMIWLVEKTVKGQKVLVPHLYLASVSYDKLEAGKASLAAGGTLDLTAKNGITNNTKIVANNLLMSTQGSLENNGTLIAHGDIRLLADQNLKNIGKISGASVGLLAKGDVTNQGSIKASDTVQIMSTQGSVINTPKAEINSQGLVSIAAQNDVKNQNGRIEGGDVNLFAQTGDIQFEAPAAGNKATGLIVHHALQMDAGHNVDLQAATISAGNNVNIHAGNDVLLTAKNTSTSGASKLESLQNTSVNRTVASVTAGNQISISADHDINAEAAKISAAGNVLLNAGNDVNLTALQQQTQTVTNYKKHSVTNTSTSYDVATLSADKNIVVTAGHNVNAQGTQFKAGNDVAIAAANDLNFNALEVTNHTQDIAKNKKVIDDKVTHQLVNIQSTDGNVQLKAGNDANLTGVNVDAKQNVVINAARDTNISAVVDSTYHYDKTTKKSGGVLTSSKRTTINETLTETAVGGEVSGEHVLINAHVNSDGQVIGDKSGNVNLLGATINAKNTAIISADEDVNASGIQLQQNEFHQTKKSGSFGLSKRDSGSVEKNSTLINASISADNNVVLLANNIKLVSADVTSANGNINMEAVDQLIVSAGEISQSAQNWNNKSGVLTGGKLYSKHEHQDGVTETSTQASNIKAAGVVAATAGEIHIKGSNISGDKGVGLTADSGDIEITAATTHEESYSHDKDLSVGFGDVVKNLSRPDQMVKNKNGRATLKFADANYSDVDEKTTINGATSSIVESKNGNVVVNATAGKVIVAASNINAEKGTVGLIGTNGVDITTVDQTIDKEKHSTVGKAEMSVVVQNQVVEVAVAAKNVEDAKDKLSNAKKDYKNYQRNLDGLETQLGSLEADYAAKKPGVTAADIAELKQLISDTKSDEKFYKEGIALAAVNVTSASTALLQQVHAASVSEGTWGFNAGIQLDVDATKSTTKSHDTQEMVSNITANNIVIQTGKKNADGTYDTKGTTTNIKGAHLTATDTAIINTGDLNMTAAQSTHESTTKTEHGHVTAQMTVYGASGGASVNASLDRSQSSERSTTNSNSTLEANNISITTSGDANFNGATVHAISDLDLDVKGNLNVESVQDRSSSRSTGAGISGGMSFGGTNATEENHRFGANDIKGTSGFNAGVNNSNSASTSRQTVLTSITSDGTATLDVKGHTQITGALIATLDDKGNDSGKLNFSTGSLDVADLRNLNTSTTHSYGASTNFSLVNSNNPTDQSTTTNGKKLNSNSSNISFTNSNTNDASKTLGTLGHGTISVGGMKLEENGVLTDEGKTSSLLNGINRDTNSTTLNLWNSSTSQTVDASIDHRLFTEAGRNEIKSDAKKSGEFVGDIANGIDLALADKNQKLSDVFTLAYNNNKATQIKNALVETPEGKNVLAALKGNGDDFANAFGEFSTIAQDKYGISPEDVKAFLLYNSSSTTSDSLKDNAFRDVKAATVDDKNNTLNGTTFVDANNGGNKYDLIKSAGHEIIERDYQLNGGKNNSSEYVADAFGDRLAYRLDQATGNGLTSTSGAQFNSQLLNSYQVIKNTEFSSLVGDANVDYRVLTTDRGIKVAKNLQAQGITIDPTKIKTQMLMGSLGESGYQELGSILLQEGKCTDGAGCVKQALNFAQSVDGLRISPVSNWNSQQDLEVFNYLNRGSGYDRTPDLSPMTRVGLINPNGVMVSDLGGGLLVPSASDSPAVVREVALEFLGDDFRNTLSKNSNLNTAFNQRLENPVDGVVDLRPFYQFATSNSLNQTAANNGLIPSSYFQETNGFSEKAGVISWNLINLKGRLSNASALNNCDACPQDIQQSHNFSGEMFSVGMDLWMVRGFASAGKNALVASYDFTKAGVTTEHLLEDTRKTANKFGAASEFTDGNGVVTKSYEISNQAVKAEGKYSNLDDPANTYRSPVDNKLRADENHAQQTASFVREPDTLPAHPNYTVTGTKLAEDLNYDMIQKNYDPAWRSTANNVVEEGVLQPGSKVYVIVDKNQLNEMRNSVNQGRPLEGLGRWSSEDPLPEKVQPARDQTAVTQFWKNDTKQDLYVVELEVRQGTTGVPTRRGQNGEVYDEGLDRNLKGGVIQHEFVDKDAAKNNLKFNNATRLEK